MYSTLRSLNLDPDDCIPRHYDDTSHHYRILLCISPQVCAEGNNNECAKRFHFDTGLVCLTLLLGHGDVIGMPQPVSGDIHLIDANGEVYRIKHSADHVDGTCSVVSHYDYKKRDGYRSYISGIDPSHNALMVGSNDYDNVAIEASYEAMFQTNKWRMENAGRAEEDLFRLLIRNDLMIGRFPHEAQSLQRDFQGAIANGLFNTIYASRPDRIPKLSTGGIYDSVRVLDLLLTFPTFQAYFVGYLDSVYIGGVITHVFVNSYDSTIPRLSPEQKEIQRLEKRIASMSEVIIKKEVNFALTAFNAKWKSKLFQDKIASINKAVVSKKTNLALTTFNAKYKIQRLEDRIGQLKNSK
jgi:hypothetical protein